MINKDLLSLREKIEKGQFPSDFKHFAGANLIITTDPNRKHFKQDVVICSPHASALSWLVIELKKIYDKDLNFRNKYDFYPEIGLLIKESLHSHEQLFDSMLHVVNGIEQKMK